MMTNDTLKYLEFIQNIITRMNANSFQIKSWAITLVSAVLALFAATKNYHFVLIGIFPAAIFWFLDAYYLQQERKFRGFYNDVAQAKNMVDLEKNYQIKPFTMRPDLYVGHQYSYWRVFFSTTIWKIYPVIIVLLIVLFVYLKLTIK